jgi:riboflavin synthase
VSDNGSVFTGLVQERGRVTSFENGRLVVESELGAQIGDSIAVDGACLTVAATQDGRLEFDVAPETLRRVKPFRREVNLESALRAGDPLGGHYVQGHVDGVARVRDVRPEGEGVRMWFDIDTELRRYVVEKGSVAIDGVSLTAAELDDAGFAVALVPHTLSATTLGTLRTGDKVNVEVDVLAKYVERLLEQREIR